jgi:hypothetical protein
MESRRGFPNLRLTLKPANTWLVNRVKKTDPEMGSSCVGGAGPKWQTPRRWSAFRTPQSVSPALRFSTALEGAEASRQNSWKKNLGHVAQNDQVTRREGMKQTDLARGREPEEKH